MYGTRSRTWRGAARLITHTLPRAVRATRGPILLSTAVFAVTMVAVMAWIAASPAALEAAMPPAAREAYLAEDFEAYYSSQPASQFAALVFTNNVRVGATAFAAGIAFGLPTLAVLAFNGAHVGLAAGLFTAAGQAGRFWGLLLPHGLLELTAVMIAGGAGLHLGWAAVAPGDRRRRDAVAAAGRTAIVLLGGVVAMFLAAGLLEAFVTPSSLPAWARVGTGALVEVVVVGHLVTAGRSP